LAGKIIGLIFLLTGMLLSGLSCGFQQQAGTGKIGVVVSVLPQQEFVLSVGRERVDVTVMVPPGANPHTYEVTPSQMIKLSGAKMYAKVGSPLEFELTWLDKLIAQNKSMLIVDCSRGVKLVESTDPDEPGIDSHIWTSVRNARIMVGNICDGLSLVDPANSSYYADNRDGYLAQLDALDKDIAATLSGLSRKTFIVYHPAWGYFASDYGLTQLAIEQGGKEPRAAYMARLVSEAKANNVKVIFVSPELDTRSAEAIAREIGGGVVAISDLAPDYVNNMRRVSAALKEALD
jgi:zinc transport system substrate-binding protein